jgi:hypothetical protein
MDGSRGTIVLLFLSSPFVAAIVIQLLILKARLIDKARCFFSVLCGLLVLSFQFQPPPSEADTVYPFLTLRELVVTFSVLLTSTFVWPYKQSKLVFFSVCLTACATLKIIDWHCWFLK